MSETFRLEERPLLGRGGEDILRILEAVARERQESVELPHCLEPARNLTARDPPPGLDGERELRAPEKESGYGSEQLISPRIEILDEARQAANLRRRPLAVGREPALERYQVLGGETLGLENVEERGEDREVARGSLGGGEDGARSRTEERGRRKRSRRAP